MPNNVIHPSLPKCPVCLQAGDEKFEIGSYVIFECRRCQHNYVESPSGSEHTERHYSDSYFTGGEAGYDDYLANRPLVEEHSRRYARLLSQFIPAVGRCFAVGAAAGFDLVGFHENGWQVTGLEPNATMCRHAKELYGFDLHRSGLESFEPDQLGFQVELVAALQVMAHFVDVRLAAQKMAALLKRDGLLLIETWNHRSVTARLLGRNWHEYSPPTVVQWFSPHSLEKLLKQFGFTKVAQGRPKKFIYGHHAASLLRYKLAAIPGLKFTTPALSLVPAKLRIPYPSEDLFWMLLRRTE